MMDTKKIKFIFIAIFVVIAGFLYSCSADIDKEEVITKIKKDSEETSKEIYDMIFVHISGAVNNPGVYSVKKGTRVFEVTKLAGGFRDDADKDYLNLAMEVSDGMKIHIYSMEEVSELKQSQGGEGELVNINTADINRLMTLPGIGEAKAKSIIKYRESNGLFKDIKDLMNIPGIKEGAFLKIADLLTI